MSRSPPREEESTGPVVSRRPVSDRPPATPVDPHCLFVHFDSTVCLAVVTPGRPTREISLRGRLCLCSPRVSDSTPFKNRKTGSSVAARGSFLRSSPISCATLAAWPRWRCTRQFVLNIKLTTLASQRHVGGRAWHLTKELPDIAPNTGSMASVAVYQVVCVKYQSK